MSWWTKDLIQPSSGLPGREGGGGGQAEKRSWSLLQAESKEDQGRTWSLPCPWEGSRTPKEELQREGWLAHLSYSPGNEGCMSLMIKGNEQHLGARLPAMTATYGRQLPPLEAGSQGQHIPAWGEDCTIQTGDSSRLGGSQRVQA